MYINTIKKVIHLSRQSQSEKVKTINTLLHYFIYTDKVLSICNFSQPRKTLMTANNHNAVCIFFNCRPLGIQAVWSWEKSQNAYLGTTLYPWSFLITLIVQPRHFRFPSLPAKSEPTVTVWPIECITTFAKSAVCTYLS